MKKHLLVLSLLLIFGTQVRIKSGFYKGCTGTVTDYDTAPDKSYVYSVDLHCKIKGDSNYSVGNKDFKESDLERLKK